MPAKGQYKYTPEEFNEAIERCMAYCLKEHEPPVNFVLHKFIDLTDRTMELYRKDGEAILNGDAEPDPIKVGYFEGLKKWDEFRTYFWARMGVIDPKVQSFAIFNLKQPCNGGYTDKQPTTSGSAEVTIKLEGVGGEKAFQ